MRWRAAKYRTLKLSIVINKLFVVQLMLYFFVLWEGIAARFWILRFFFIKLYFLIHQKIDIITLSFEQAITISAPKEKCPKKKPSFDPIDAIFRWKKIVSSNYFQSEDGGLYECQVSTTPVMSHHVFLNVAGKCRYKQFSWYRIWQYPFKNR